MRLPKIFRGVRLLIRYNYYAKNIVGSVPPAWFSNIKPENREQFVKDISDFSDGQKKKVMIAASLCTPAHLYIWDEPLNYLDVYSRRQLEELLVSCKPTMLIVEHDRTFCESVNAKNYYFNS